MKQLRDISEQLAVDYQSANYRHVDGSEQIEFAIGTLRVRCLGSPEAVTAVREKYRKASGASWIRRPTIANLRSGR